MFLRNAWYVAAWSTEIGAAPFARTILDEPVVFYRLGDGSVVALEDRCCHRGLPLSMGRIEGDRLRCGYHGLLFDETGTCIEVPGQSQIPPGAAVGAYPVRARWGWIWIWMGDPDRADPALIPDWWWMDHSEWRVVEGNRATPLHIDCNYELITDNLMDVSHLTYVHSSSIGAESIPDFPIKTERRTRSVHMTRWVLDRPAAPFYQAAGKFVGNVDRWMITDTDLPCHTVNDVGCAPVGTGATDGDRSQAIEFRVLNAPTPETATSTHYFYARPRRFAQDSAEMDEIFHTQFDAVFIEDKEVLEAQQRQLDVALGAGRIDINVDTPAIAVRRMLRAMIDRESIVVAS